MKRVAVVAGAVLGVLSRVEETTPVSVGISANATWLGVAFVVGVAHRRVSPARAAGTGALALTAANVAFYASIAAFEPGVALSSVAGSPAVWLALGLGGGALFAAAGRWWATSAGMTRVLASLPLAGVCITEGVSALTGGPLGDVIGLAFGAALPVASAASARERAVGAALSLAVVGVALTGRLEALMP